MASTSGSETQIKNIRAAFLKRQSRCAKQIGEASFQIGFRHVRVKFPARHGFEDEVLASVLVLPLAECAGSLRRIAPVENRRSTKQLEAASRREHVLQLCRVRAFDRDRCFSLSLKLSRRLRSVRSRRLRFQLSSRSRGFSSFCGRRSISSSNCGTSSRTCATTAEVSALDDRSSGAAEIERFDPGGARPPNVDCEFENRFRVLGDLFRALLDRLLETGGLPTCQEGCLDKDHFLELNALPQHLRVIDDAGREIFIDKPHADESMSFGWTDKWIQPRLFEARCIEQR